MKIVNNFANYRGKPVFRGLVILALSALFIWTAVSCVLRIGSEAKNDTVEICVDWDEVCDLCALNGYPPGDFLERSRAIGAASVALGEETLSSLSCSGKVVFFSMPEYSRARMLDIAAQGGMVSNNLIASQDQDIAKGLADILQGRYNVSVKTQKAGKYYLLYPSLDPVFTPAYWNENIPLGFYKDRQKFLISKDLKAVYKIRSDGYPAWIKGVSTENVSGIMWDGSEVPGYGGRESDLSGILKDRKIKYIGMEFASFSGEENIEKSLPGLLVRGHTINEAELARNHGAAFWLSRWMRAIKERNIRFVYFHFWKNMPVEENISYLRIAARNIKDAGFKLGTADPPAYPSRGWHLFWEICALGVSVFIPLGGLKMALRKSNYLHSFAVVNAASIFGGILVSSMLYDVYFMQKIIELPLVRFIFFLTLGLSALVVFKPEQIKRFWNIQIGIKHLFIAAAVMAAAVVLFVRSGNSAADWMVPDHGLRQMLENVLPVRPRTKEFIIGQPLLMLGFYTKNPWIIFAGMIGQASIFNTFMHAHSPLAISLMRTAQGLLLGFVIGFLLIEVLKITRNLMGKQS